VVTGREGDRDRNEERCGFGDRDRAGRRLGGAHRVRRRRRQRRSELVARRFGARVRADASGRWTIWLVAPDGTAPHEAIGGGADNRFPQWSPADGRLAFVSDRGGVWGLYVGAPQGTQQELMGAVAPDSPARWSPDGAALAVAATGDCRRFGIYVVSSSAPSRPARRSNQCRIDGTSGPDVLRGTPYYDVINGHGGGDSLFAGNGDDIVYGGPGDDAIGGGPGNDLIYGGPGNDVLSGATGNDIIYAGPGRDRIGCGPGNDTAYIGPGDTTRDCEHVHRS
jgi:Ca2+-binding RTX toxin-like protein